MSSMAGAIEHIATAIPPKGTEIAAGIVQPGNFGGAGRGTQFYFMKPVMAEWFKKGGKIP
jgi:hypothetical protein